jgi:hypothetical protein
MLAAAVVSLVAREKKILGSEENGMETPARGST